MKSQNNYIKWGKYILLLLFVSLIAIGCKDGGITNPGNNPPAGENNMLEIIQSNSNLTILAELLEGTSLTNTLSGSGKVTFFAPTNAAFSNLPDEYLEGLTSQQKLDLLKYHIYSGTYPVINEIKKEVINSLHGDPIFMEIGQSFGNLINNQAKFGSTNIEASNGLIHLIDAVLIPDQQGTLADNIKKRYDYRKFYEKLDAAGLIERLEAPGMTIVLPENDMGIDYIQNDAGLSLTDENWTEIMKYHLLEVDFTVYGPGTKTALVTLSGDSVYLQIESPGQFLVNNSVDGNPISVVNATNGKIVFPSGVLLPDKFLGILTIMDKRFTMQTARSALAVAKMTGRLYNTDNNADEMFTIFIPHDNAEGLNGLPADENELANVMKYHVLLEKVTADALQHNQTYTTWQGETLTITKNGDEIIVNGSATVKQADLIGRNGVVHIINGVLTPPSD
ncbi:fasciclin domain-containing protein [Aliifodinibius salicampi]|uniref:Fasciclin domain-containing protein n=1 Tax=Fodinibius salicampi TaxID=1920655 RepID=A0ABT3Q353_9BACT|nr:fasciclin domain-containing protein [Fodinibius salicampi]MCW9714549.1 fasciclin domain-containing protein [Fodinibius salicampi]